MEPSPTNNGEGNRENAAGLRRDDDRLVKTSTAGHGRVIGGRGITRSRDHAFNSVLIIIRFLEHKNCVKIRVCDKNRLARVARCEPVRYAIATTRNEV